MELIKSTVRNTSLPGKRGCYRWEMNTLLNGKEKTIKNLVF